MKRTRESAEAGRFCNTHTMPSAVGRGARPGGHRLPEQGCLPPGTEVVEAIRGWLLSFWYQRPVRAARIRLNSPVLSSLKTPASGVEH